MATKFIPVSKMTKKQQKEYYAKHRSTWNGLNSVLGKAEAVSAWNRMNLV